LLGQQFIFQQDGAPSHAAKSTQQWLAAHCPDFINKDAWPPNSPDLNPLDYRVWVDAGEVQLSESTTKEYLGTEDCITEDMGRTATRCGQEIDHQLSQASERLHQHWRWIL